LSLDIRKGDLWTSRTERRRENNHNQHALWLVGAHSRIGPDRRL
jgi:hypothetical protein